MGKNFNNAMEIFQILPKTNCKECGQSTCLAFAGAVFTGKVALSACTYVPQDKLQLFGGGKKGSNPIEEEFYAVIRKLQTRLLSLDTEEIAKKVKAEYDDGIITIPILGKRFSIDRRSKITTNIHVNGWILKLVLNYLIYSKGLPLSHNWVPLRELPSGKDWYRLFGQQCENILKATADKYPDLFSDLVDMFKAEEVVDQYESDVAVILYPLPLVPMLICYWQPEDGMESSLKLFFDDTAESNIGMDGLYTLGVGFAVMLERLSMVHSSNQPAQRNI